jgi:hypothetical protein
VSRLTRTVLAAATAVLVSPPAASAHLRTGTTAVDYQAAVSEPRPSPTAAFRVGVYASDLALHLATRGSHTVVVLGYLGEPFLRVGPHGTAVNPASPTAAASGLLPRGTASSRRRESWRLTPGRRSVVWHDSRVAALAPTALHGTWRIPIILDGRRSEISGRIRRLPPPTLWPWLTLLALIPMCAALWWTGTRAHPKTVCIVYGSVDTVAALALIVGFALDPYASAGTWIAGADETAFFAAAGAAAVWAPARFRVGGALGLGLLALAVGLSKGAIFLHAVVLSTLPGDLSRLLSVIAIGCGGTGAVLGGIALARDSAAYDDDVESILSESLRLR